MRKGCWLCDPLPRKIPPTVYRNSFAAPTITDTYRTMFLTTAGGERQLMAKSELHYVIVILPDTLFYERRDSLFLGHKFTIHDTVSRHVHGWVVKGS